MKKKPKTRDIVNIEHEKGQKDEEIEFQIKWRMIKKKSTEQIIQLVHYASHTSNTHLSELLKPKLNQVFGS